MSLPGLGKVIVSGEPTAAHTVNKIERHSQSQQLPCHPTQGASQSGTRALKQPLAVARTGEPLGFAALPGVL